MKVEAYPNFILWLAVGLLLAGGLELAVWGWVLWGWEQR